MYALRRLAHSNERDRFVVSDLLVRGEEGRYRARFDAGLGWWQRIRVKQAPSGELQFEALTQLARAHASLHPTQRKAVDAFVEQAIGTTSADPSLGQTLFELLVPNDFKAYAPDRRKLLLILDTDTAALPWELLQDRSDTGAEPMAVAGGMIRQLIVDEPRRTEIMRAPAPTSLIVGNPVVADKRFPDLPGAAEEADAVARLLVEQSYEVRVLTGADAHPQAVMTALHERPWRILHLAAHGVFEFRSTPDAPPVSGLVLDNGIILGPADVEQMRVVPDLVFVNCCHLGQTRESDPRRVAFHRLAANLGSQFIQMGVRAVVAAGWAVDDAAANAFAAEFYGQMFGGSSFGEAVAAARRHLYNAYGGTNTWGAYQCYGDPGYSLVQSESRATREAWVSPTETTVWAADVRASTRGRDEEGRRRLLGDLEEGLTTLPAAWWDEPELCASVASAFGALGQLERAVEDYEKIRTMEQASAPVRALEQLANAKVQWAWQLWQVKGRHTGQPAELIRDAENILASLLAIGETAERFALLGGLHKRRAMMSTGRGRRKALDEMTRAYARAFEIGGRQSPRDGAYQLENRLAAQIVLSWSNDRPAAARRAEATSVKEGLETLAKVAEELQQTSTSFFHLATKAHCRLLTALAGQALTDAARREIEQAYADASARGVSPHDRRSTADQIAFLDLMAASVAGKQARDLSRQLSQLRETLAG